MSLALDGSGAVPGYLASGLLARHGLPHLFTTRHFPKIGSPAIPEGPLGPAVRAAIRGHGFDPDRVAFARQVHGAGVAVARDGGRAGTADALLTDRPGVGIAVFTADCLPIVIYDPGDGHAGSARLAVVHAGWRGTTQSVARAAFEAVIGSGGNPRRIVAAIGPSIGPCCYEVDGPVIERLDAAFQAAWSGWVVARGPGRWLLDLWCANRDQLVGAGLDPSRIDNLRMCTSCRPDLFFSYRRGARGRLAAFAALPGPSRSPC
jgi:YfiH family protein